jgi:hypothetical protein
MEIMNNKKNSTMSKSVNVPEKKFNISGITATVWKNDGLSKTGEAISFRTVTFEKNYKDKDGSWKATNTLRINDLPKASLVLSKAYEYISMSSMS